MIIRHLMLGAAVLGAPLPALASPVVSLDSAVFVERTQMRDGTLIRALEPAQRLCRGDRVVTLIVWKSPGINWTRQGGSGGFTMVNALPAGLVYQRSAEDDEEVSIDGRIWGKLARLHVGTRHATPEDVTHLRWRISPQQALSGAGQIAYAGFVR